ncbi:SGNH hydrolase-type esterase domain-containing protein [Aspergillus granulosus]|uniref:SGNH hydrolase-type esterase domain-containing protein n=1 Tax=Aspergillus granulosus TaxID=176169 RepID=A0ABR4HKT6_9EURO
MKTHILALAIAGTVAGQLPPWAQCGGIGYIGTTVCAAGYSCMFQNDYYSQCRPETSGSLSSSTTFSTRTSSMTTPPTPTSTETEGSAPVQYLGRVNPATKELTWPGTGVAFTFRGSSAVIHLAQVSGTNSVELTIDDDEPIVISNVVGSSISIPNGLPYATHTVQLRKRSEYLFGTITLGNITTDGELLDYTAPARKIEVIGDSITVGYGLDGTNPCTNTAALENNPKTYAALAAKALAADYSVIAWSGKGLVRNIATGAPDTSPVMPELYTRYGANDADGSYPFTSTDWTPNAVVITLGTNDFNYLAYDASGQPYNARLPMDPETYTAGMVNFVESIQAHFPNAHFFLLASTMLSDTWPTAADAQHTTLTSALKAAVAQIGANAHFVDWPTQGADVGCDYHPNAATHATQGEVLASVIRAVLGW